MKHPLRSAAFVALLIGAIQAHGQTVTYNFSDATSDGWSASGFGSAPAATVTNFGGSNFIFGAVGGFQALNVSSAGSASALYQAMQAAAANPSGYEISYNWYVDTSAFGTNIPTFMQLGTYVNGGNGDYFQDFGLPNEAALNGTQLASGQVFSGTVTINLATVGFDLSPTNTFYRLGLIVNGNNPGASVGAYFTDISLTPVPSVPSVSSLGEGIIGVHFDQTVTNSAGTAIDPGNYTILGKGAGGAVAVVTNAILQPDLQTVGLYLNSDPGEFFAVGVSNVIDDTGNTENAAVTGYTSDFSATNIGTSDDPLLPGQVVSGLPDTFYVTASGSGIGDTNDHCHFVYEQVSGNFDTSVLVTQLADSPPTSEACLMARQNLSAGSASVEICLQPGSSNILMLARGNSNANAESFAGPVFFNSLCWLRMTCTNNLYTVYYGSNGVDWTVGGSISNSLGSPFVGMAVSPDTGMSLPTTTAGFTQFSVSGPRPGDTVVPTLSSSIYQKTNLVVSWQRTPRDFAVQVGTNLNFSGSTASNAFQWGYLMQPIFDTSLTGTNAEVPTPATRYMTIPMNLFSNNNQMFVRLAKVARVIPDPLTVTPGIILSAGAGNLVAGSSAMSLCSDSIASSSVLTLPANTVLVCPAGHTYQFTTSPSGSLLHTVLQTRNQLTTLTTCDGNFSAGNNKAQITFSLPAKSIYTNYTFVAASTTDTSVTNGIVVQVNITQ